MKLHTDRCSSDQWALHAGLPEYPMHDGGSVHRRWTGGTESKLQSRSFGWRLRVSAGWCRPVRRSKTAPNYGIVNRNIPRGFDSTFVQFLCTETKTPPPRKPSRNSQVIYIVLRYSLTRQSNADAMWVWFNEHVRSISIEFPARISY